MPGEDGVDLREVGTGDGEAERPQVLRHLGGLAKTDEGRGDGGVAQRPAQRELRERLVVLGGEALELLDGSEILWEVLGAEQRAEQVEVAEHAAARAPVALLERHARV